MGQEKGNDEQEAFEQAMRLENAVEMLCHQITKSHHSNPDPDMAIVIDVATTDKKAIELGWPSAKLMRNAIDLALKQLPLNISERVELDEV